MKIGFQLKPEWEIKQGWEGQFDVFSLYHSVINIPTHIFMVTTLKENGLSNLQLNAWGMLIGSGQEPKFIMQVMKSSDTYRLLQEESEFVVSIPGFSMRDKILTAANHYTDEVDEITAAGFTKEASAMVAVPGVKECFARMECVVDWVRDVEEEVKVNALIQGKVVYAAIDEEYVSGEIEACMEKRGYTYFVGEHYNHGTRCCTDNGMFVTLDTRSMKKPGEK